MDSSKLEEDNIGYDDDDDDKELRNIGVTRNEPEIEEEIIEDEEILKNIDDCYFNSEDCFDAQHYQLKVGCSLL